MAKRVNYPFVNQSGVPHVPKLAHRLPRARLHKASGLARVRIDGRDHYLGRFGTPEAKAAYDQLITEYLAAKRQPAAQAADAPGPAILEVINTHREHAAVHYRRPDGSATGEAENYRLALRPLRQLYGRLPASQFGPLELQTVRETMIRTGKLSRRTINARINRVRKVFRWAASRGMVPGQVYQDLKTVDGLLEGRTAAREAAGIVPVDEALVEKALPYMPGPVAAMVRIQLLTGCRVGEVLIMRGADLESGEGTCAYTPSTHKNAWRGQPA
jgi:integrase